MWRGGHEKKSDNLAYLADLARAAGDDLAVAMGLAMSGLDETQRNQLLRGMFPLLPPLARLAVFGCIGLDTAKDAISAAEQRPSLVWTLVEHGRQTQTLNLAYVPPETHVDIKLCWWDGIQPPPGRRAVEQAQQSFMLLRALGEGAFEPLHRLVYPAQRDRRVEQEPHRVFRVGGVTPHGDFDTTIRYGGPLAVPQHGGKPLELHFYKAGTAANEYRAAKEQLVVGGVALDGHEVFWPND